MSLRCGIVGLPNIGKSTLFNGLGSATAASSNYPFCTIEPNIAVVNLPDPCLSRLGHIFQPERLTPATTRIVDIAGIVKGASRGEGLGNQFLSHIREVDAIIHLVRCFTDENIVHVEGKVDPAGDIEVVNTELLLADLETAERKLQKCRKAFRVGNKEAGGEIKLLELLIDHLNQGKPARTCLVEPGDQVAARELFLLSAKPVLYVANTRSRPEDAPLLEAFTRFVAAENAKHMVLDCKLEEEIAAIVPADRSEYLEAAGLEEPGLNRFIHAVFDLLDLITFYTVVGPEVRAWTVPKGTRTPQAAGLIHSDFEKGFIRAECYKSQELLRLGSEAKIREAGLYRIEGKEYIVSQGDILFFRFNL